MRRLLLMLLSLSLFMANSFAETGSKTYGKTPVISDPTAIADLLNEPAKYHDSSVLLVGTIVDVCQHAGCWVEIESSDSSRVICRSIDESIHFPKNVVGKSVRLQGKVLYDTKSSGVTEEKVKDGETHDCPAPKIMVSIEGATVADASITETPSAQPIE